MKSILLICLLWAVPARSATLYVKAAGGELAASATWSGTGSAGVDSAGPPASTDTCILEAGSGNVSLTTGNLTCDTVSMTAGTGDYAGTITATAGVGADAHVATLTGAMAGAVWTASSAVTIAGDLVITILPANVSRTFVGAGKTYSILSVLQVGTTDELIITGANSFGMLSVTMTADTTNAHTVTLPVNATTTVFDLFVYTTGGHTLSFVSSSASTPATITKSSGVVNVDYLSLTDISATGGTTWCAGANGVDGGGNAGWVFAACPQKPALQMTGVGR